MARYQCPMCGWVYDEELEGAPLSELIACRCCGTPTSELIEVTGGDATGGSPLPAMGDAARRGLPRSPIAVDERMRRQGPSIRHMAMIHDLAEFGAVPDGAMATDLPLPAWEDILLLGAQLDPPPLADDAEVDISCVIGPSAARPLALAGPAFVSHMSFGALSREAKVALARGASAAGTAMCSGEGGILPEERAAARRYIFEYTPNAYSVTDENLRAADAVEIKIGQGTKPGMGGHLLGAKVTPEIARIRCCEPGQDCISPSTIPGVRDARSLRALVDDLRARSAGAPIGVKIAAGRIERDIDVAVAADVDYITVDGRGGATGASPIMLRDATSVPTIHALIRARRRLDATGSSAGLVITGGLRVASDIAKAIALGADSCALATASLMALGCQQYRLCSSGRCPMGIATQDLELRAHLDIDSGAARVANFYRATFDDLRMFCRVTGHTRLSDLGVCDLATLDASLVREYGLAFA